jgi:phage tail protein X
MSYLTHITVEGERWDQLAARYYGSPYAYEQIINANPGVPIGPRLPGGVELLIPVVEVVTAVAADELPPWKR